MRAFLTGASGFVGGHVLRLLASEGARVRCLVRQGSSRANLEGVPADVVVGDLRDAAAVERAVEGCEVVFHCAADYRLYVREPREMYASNVAGTENVLRAAVAAGARRIVYTSSVGALGLAADGTPANERTPVTLADMVGHYKRSKFLAEQAAARMAAAGAPVVIVNPSTPVGEADLKPTATGRIVLDFLRQRIPAYVDTGLNLIDVRDVARGHLLAAERGRLGERYILGHRNLSLREILETLARITGLPAPRLRLPHFVPIAAAAIATAAARLLGGEPRVSLEAALLARHKMYFDAGKAVRELRLPQSPVEAALERAVRWFEVHGYVATGTHGDR